MSSDNVTYSWRYIAGPNSPALTSLWNSDKASANILVSGRGEYVMEVTATKGSTGEFVKDTVTVYANNPDNNGNIPGRIEAEAANRGNGLGYVDMTPVTMNSILLYFVCRYLLHDFLGLIFCRYFFYPFDSFSLSVLVLILHYTIGKRWRSRE